MVIAEMNGRLSTTNPAMVSEAVGPGGEVGGASDCATSGDRRLVLLLSEDALMTRALTRILHTAGYEVTTGGGATGAAMDEIPRPALVIIDVPDDRSPRQADLARRTLRGIDGIRTLWIGDAGDVVQRSDGQLAKPFTGAQLLTKVASLMEN